MRVSQEKLGADDLFKMLKDEDCIVFAHIGGRYADIKMSHDARIERSVEVHSDWGTFEWLVQDAFERALRAVLTRRKAIDFRTSSHSDCSSTMNGS